MMQFCNSTILRHCEAMGKRRKMPNYLGRIRARRLVSMNLSNGEEWFNYADTLNEIFEVAKISIAVAEKLRNN